MAKVYFTTNDPVIDMIYDEKETTYFFGSDFLDEYGVEFPDDLLKRYQNNFKEFQNIQKEIEKWMKENL